MDKAKLSLGLAYQIHKKYDTLPANVVFTVAGLLVSSDNDSDSLINQVFQATGIIKPAGFNHYVDVNLSTLYDTLINQEEDLDEEF